MFVYNICGRGCLSRLLALQRITEVLQCRHKKYAIKNTRMLLVNLKILCMCSLFWYKQPEILVAVILQVIMCSGRTAKATT